MKISGFAILQEPLIYIYFSLPESFFTNWYRKAPSKQKYIGIV
jgi:hypothetical protein